ncbi:MAG: hypothetical protein ACREOO_00410 [bacterium]
MGQQQLLLLILSAIIVGIAIVMGINMFGENAIQANQDAVMQDVLTIAARAQGWFRRPQQLGGGGRDFSAVTLGALNFSDTTNGTYAISAAGANSFIITGTGQEDAGGAAGPLAIAVTVLADSISPATITP